MAQGSSGIAVGTDILRETIQMAKGLFIFLRQA